MQKKIIIKAFAALFLLTLIWGYNWVVMKTAVQYASPFQFAALRTFLGALMLFLVLFLSKRPLALKEFPTMLALRIAANMRFYGLADLGAGRRRRGKNSGAFLHHAILGDAICLANVGRKSARLAMAGGRVCAVWHRVDF